MNLQKSISSQAASISAWKAVLLTAVLVAFTVTTAMAFQFYFFFEGLYDFQESN